MNGVSPGEILTEQFPAGSKKRNRKRRPIVFIVAILLNAVLCDLIWFGFPTHIIFRESPGCALEESCQEVLGQRSCSVHFPDGIEWFFSNLALAGQKENTLFSDS